MHLRHTLDALGERFPAAQFGAVTGVFGHGDVVGQSTLIVSGEPGECMPFAVKHIGAGHLPVTGCGDGFFHGVLHLFNRGVGALPIVQLEHLRNRLGDLGRSDEAVAVQPEAGQQVVAIGIGGVVGKHLAERQGDGASDLVLVIADERTIALDDLALGGGDVALQQLGPVSGHGEGNGADKFGFGGHG